MKYYEDARKAPFVKYEMIAESEGEYTAELYLMTRNPVKRGERCRFAISVNESAPVAIYAVSENYYTEWFNLEWAHGVLDHGRIVSTNVSLKKGLNEVYIYAGEPGVIIEKIVLHPAENPIPESMLGPGASCKL